MSDPQLTFIDLFSGCGGFSEGFLSSGKFRGLAHVEWELPMVETLRNRLHEKWKFTKEDSLEHVVHFDIQKTNELINGNWREDTIDLYAKTNSELVVEKGLKGLVNGEKVDLIIGGPPCQAYSIAGRAQDKNSMKDDYRNYLFESFVKVVKAFQPEIFVFENVPGMLSAKPGGIEVTKRVHEAFSAIGYKIEHPKRLKHHVFNASDYNTPQNRNRLIIIGVKLSEKYSLSKIYEILRKSKKSNKPLVKDAIEKLPKIVPVHSDRHFENKSEGVKISHEYRDQEILTEEFEGHIPRYHNLRDIEIFSDWVKNKMNKKNIETKIQFYKDRTGHDSNHAKYRNLEWDTLAPTIVAHLQKDGLMFIHPDENQARSITIREAALLQSFPMDYKFLGSMGYNYKMIGNAVPPKLGEAIAYGIAEYLENYNNG